MGMPATPVAASAAVVAALGLAATAFASVFASTDVAYAAIAIAWYLCASSAGCSRAFMLALLPEWLPLRDGQWLFCEWWQAVFDHVVGS